MLDQSRNRKRDSARRKYLIVDEYLANKGSKKIALLESLHHIAKQIEKHQKITAKLEDDFIKVSVKIGEIDKEIWPKTLEHKFCYRLMNEHKRPPRNAPNGVVIQQVDLYGNVIEQFDSIQKASNDTGVHRDIIAKICKGVSTNCNIKFRRKLGY